MPHNRYKEVRLGTLVTYIRAARPRPNLVIRAGCHVDRIILKGARAEGVTFLDSARERRIAHADEIAISAGVYNSPAILQRSGIGPAAWLRPLGIEVVADLPVGRNLTDHPGFPMLFRAEGLGVTTGRFFAANVRGPANAQGEPEWQTHPFPVDEEEHTAGFWTYITRQAATGEVRIHSAEPMRAPLIDHHYNTSQRDRDRFADARSFVKAMLATKTFQSHGAVAIDDLDKPITEALTGAMGPAHHQAGSVRVGPPGDPTAVVAPDLRVHGFDNLRVADTSIYPDNVMHNTNLTAIVVGEVAARAVELDAAPQPTACFVRDRHRRCPFQVTQCLDVALRMFYVCSKAGVLRESPVSTSPRKPHPLPAFPTRSAEPACAAQVLGRPSVGRLQSNCSPC